MEPKRYMNPVHHGQHPHHYGPCHPCPGGRVGIIGQIELTVRYVDHHGHVRYFPIKQGEMYCIEALSSTKGICTFMGKVVDFDSIKGIERILKPPHSVDVGAIIVDYSTDYEAKIIRIGVENITKITPLESIDHVTPCGKDTFFIDDPFAQHELDENTAEAESEIENL